MEALSESAFQEAIDRELHQVDAAIELVDSGAARRVTLVNLRLASGLLNGARVRAARHGLRIIGDWSLGDGRCTVIVEPVSAAS